MTVVLLLHNQPHVYVLCHDQLSCVRARYTGLRKYLVLRVSLRSLVDCCKSFLSTDCTTNTFSCSSPHWIQPGWYVYPTEALLMRRHTLPTCGAPLLSAVSRKQRVFFGVIVAKKSKFRRTRLPNRRISRFLVLGSLVFFFSTETNPLSQDVRIKRRLATNPEWQM